MSVRADLIAWLQEQPSVAALVGDRVFDAPPPRGTAMPYVVAMRNAVIRPRDLKNVRTEPTRTQIQLSCWAQRHGSEAEAVATAIRRALEARSGERMGDSTVRLAVVEGETDVFDDDTRNPGVQLDVLLRHTED